MKGLPFLLGLLIVLFALFALAPSTAEGQTYLPHVGRIIAPTTPTVELTVAVVATNTITPTATATRTPTITPTPSITPTPTNSPTITPTPTKTGTPTTTPTVTPTPTDTIGDGVIVLNSHHDYLSYDLNEDGRVTVVGEVRNDTQSNATNIKVTVTLYNNRVDVVDSIDLYVWRDVLKPGEKSCFEAVFLGYPAYNRYGFETAYTSTGADPRPLEIYGDGALYLEEQGAWHLFGQIRNTQQAVEGQTAEPLPYPQIIGTLYHEMGHVMDCMYINALAETLVPGESSIWQMTLRPLPQADVKGYRVQAR